MDLDIKSVTFSHQQLSEVVLVMESEVSISTIFGNNELNITDVQGEFGTGAWTDY